MNLVVDNELGMNRMDYFINAYRDQIERNYLPIAEGGAGWNLYKMTLGFEYDYTYADYTECVEYMRSWLLKRITWLDERLNPNQPQQ